MPRYKTLKGVAHNIGHSFTSLMNYSVDDYSMGHILRLARETGHNKLTIDFVTGHGYPSDLLVPPIAELPVRYTKTFWTLVQSSGSDRELVKTATLTLTYDLLRTIPGPTACGRQSPYRCDVAIVDIRGKSYGSHFEGWWYVERHTDLPSFVQRWWNPFSWCRHG